MLKFGILIFIIFLVSGVPGARWYHYLFPWPVPADVTTESPTNTTTKAFKINWEKIGNFMEDFFKNLAQWLQGIPDVSIM